jgi:hypothetical protein
MTHKKHIIPIVLTTLLLCLVMACKQDPSTPIATPSSTNEREQEALVLDTFSTFPPEIDGCSCYFSNDSIEFKKKEYIYMNDYAQTSFLKINGELVKFTEVYIKQVDSLQTKAKYRSNAYEMIIETQVIQQNGYETSLESGIIKVTDQNGSTITKPFYGECGC